MIVAGGDGAHRGILRHFDRPLTLDSCTMRKEELHYVCCCVLTLVPEMARVTGEQALAFTMEELEKLVDGVLTLSAPIRKGDCGKPPPKKGGTDPGGLQLVEPRCRKLWEDLRCWARKTGEAQLGKASQ
ncbi:hypothetical protein NDU88_005277 [Pleurodeles waltl]|uniref:Uncharacterized protein n=1 Tax=Pleurodeles waltl TaxID=8319 RepID=A0AAV7RIK9_PLEWA|nr:hypothetical protein NDU88_005277 [Pleurodeles waltl]